MQRHALKRHYNLPHSLNTLRVFEAAARYLSFTHAATELNVTQSAVSRQIRQLEDNLGFALFNRLHRALELTSEGQELSMLLSRQFGELNRAIYQLAPSLQGELKIKVETSLAARWLAPRLHKFRKLHPNLQVNLTLAWFQAGVNINLDSGGYDIALFGEKYPDSRYANNSLRCEYMAPIYHPALCENQQVLTVAQAIDKVRIHPTQDRSDWQHWLSSTGNSDQSLDKGITFNSLDLAIIAATAGEGVAMMDLMLVLDELENTRLLLPERVHITQSPWQYYYYVAPEANATDDINAFIAWLYEEFSQDQRRLFKLASENGWNIPKVSNSQ
ncbi:MAG: LysR substrate-binding domain-containing protein [Pseudomonadales bacterium]|nr:LysR substrate-binding domain-containing protein [Pseudomonadales bacterium]NRA14560.1 LysR family transcriptional regulator [Oceanospirillaceae bacterium]